MFARTLYFLLSLPFFMIGCGSDFSKREATSSSFSLYRLHAPDEVYFLPQVLKEVSGIHLVDDYRMACVQDEKGIVFVFNMKNRKIEQHHPFWKNGDYEDVVVDGKTAYVLKSNGTIYELSNYLSKHSKMQKMGTPLCKGNDVEGMTLINRNELWLACKGDAGICEKKDGIKAVYAFSLATKKLNKHAVIEVVVDSLHGRTSLKRLRSFSPSGIALHPITGDVYLTSSQGRLLVILSKEGSLLYALPLDHPKMTQPEGICFAPNGDLYISNEGKGGAGNIMFFKYRNGNE
jgi:hypothetical protein